MKSQLGRMDAIDFQDLGDTQYISFPIPDDFGDMDLGSRVLYVAAQLKSLESEFPDEKGKLTRHTTLAGIEGDRFLYAVMYVTLLDSDY